jgi:nitrate reductase gamma subunit
MWSFNMIAFLVYPYIALTIFVVGHSYRYLADAFRWNSKSSELLDKGSLRIGILMFHWGIIFTFVGHFFGLLTPQWFLDKFGITAHIHETAAISVGMVIGTMASIGLALLLGRRLVKPRILVTSSLNDIIVLLMLLFVVGWGTFNAFFMRYDVIYTIAPWIRSIVTFSPDPELMRPVPWTYKVHILSALALLGYSPFTRLVHIWSVPIAYLVRRFILFRRRVVEIT